MGSGKKNEGRARTAVCGSAQAVWSVFFIFCPQYLLASTLFLFFLVVVDGVVADDVDSFFSFRLSEWSHVVSPCGGRLILSRQVITRRTNAFRAVMYIYERQRSGPIQVGA